MKAYYKDKNGILRYFDTLVGVIDVDSEYWSCFKNRMGFNPETNPLPVIIDAPIESTHQIVVRGGRGRWNSIDFPDAAFVNGSHLFEGWDAQEKYRLSMLIGKYKEGTANIFSFMPSYNGVETFGVINIGCDKQYKGTDFSTDYLCTWGHIIAMSGFAGGNNFGSQKYYGGTSGAESSSPSGANLEITARANEIPNQARFNDCTNGLVVPVLDTNPTILNNGTIWYDSIEHKYKGVVNGEVKSFIME